MLSCSLIGEDDNGMQRDYWYEVARAAQDFPDPATIGRKAAERTLARLHAQQLDTRECPVLFAPEVARGLVGHLVSAVSGGSLYRRASFLVDHAGKTIFPDFVEIVERPHLQRGLGSGTFDAEGVATVDSDLVRGGSCSATSLAATRRASGLQAPAMPGARTTSCQAGDG
jgi:PmbA protein